MTKTNVLPFALSERSAKHVWTDPDVDRATFCAIPVRALYDGSLTLSQLKVLADVGRQDPRRGFVRLSQKRRAARLAMSRSTYNRALHELIGRGYIDVEPSDHPSGCRAYKILIDHRSTACSVANTAPLISAQLRGCATDRSPPDRCAQHNTDKDDSDDITLSPPSPERTVASVENQCASGGFHGERHAERDSAAGWAKHWTIEAQGIVEDMRGSASLSHVVSGFIDRVRGTLNPAKDSDACAYVGLIANRLRDFPQAVLEATAETMIDTRSGYLPAIADVVKVAKGAAGTVQSELFKAAAERIDVSTEQGAAYSAAQQALRAIVGEDKFAAWFVKLVPTDVSDGRLLLIAPSKFHANYVSTHFAQAMDAAARAAGLRSVVVTHPTGVVA